MKTIALLAAVGLTSAASAQDIVITINPFDGSIRAEFLGTLPAGTTGLSQVWSDVGIRLSGNGPITISSFDPSYTSFLTPNGPVITDNGSSNVLFLATAGGPIFGTPFNNSNPFSPFSFSYGGSFSAFRAELVGQNTTFFIGGPFGTPLNFQNANGSPGVLTFELFFPSPSTATLLGIAGLAVARRRR